MRRAPPAVTAAQTLGASLKILRSALWGAGRLLYGALPMEHTFECPYCGEEISMVLDFSVGRQTYVEDCEVCCQPIEISYTVEDEELAGFLARTLN